MNSSGYRPHPVTADRIWIGDSAPIQWLKTQIHEAADTDLPVLLIGEMGTGRRLCARTLHNLSRRSKGPFVLHDCAGTHAARVDRQLFGSVPVDPADQREPGQCEKARGGTLMLEGVDALPSSTQLRLLDAVRARQLQGPGITTPIDLDVRWVAATQRDLQRMSRSGSFCAELCYRLSLVPIKLPPLREHRADIPTLALHFVEQCAGRMGRPSPTITRPVMQALLRHDWPGNVWELKRTLERAVVLSGDSDIRLEHVHLPLSVIPRDPRSQGGPGSAFIGLTPPGGGGHPDLN